MPNTVKLIEIAFLFYLFQNQTGVHYKFDNSSNLCHEAAHVRQCLLDGRMESPKLPLQETMLLAELMETVRKQVGVSYPQD